MICLSTLVNISGTEEFQIASLSNFSLLSAVASSLY